MLTRTVLQRELKRSNQTGLAHSFGTLGRFRYLSLVKLVENLEETRTLNMYNTLELLYIMKVEHCYDSSIDH